MTSGARLLLSLLILPVRGVVFMMVWNHLVPFDVPDVGFWQSIGLAFGAGALLHPTFIFTVDCGKFEE